MLSSWREEESRTSSQLLPNLVKDKHYKRNRASVEQEQAMVYDRKPSPKSEVGQVYEIDT